MIWRKISFDFVPIHSKNSKISFDFPCLGSKTERGSFDFDIFQKSAKNTKKISKSVKSKNTKSIIKLQDESFLSCKKSSRHLRKDNCPIYSLSSKLKNV